MPDKKGTGANHSPYDVGFGIYIHWPFCLSKCPYCDFNSHVRHQKIDNDAFADGLVRELQHYHRQTGDRTVTSVFFGGGTPSLMPPNCVEKVLQAIEYLWDVAGDVEITLEANPTSIEAKNFAGYRAAGVNRVSVGIQALVNDDLQKLGRQHTVAEALAAFKLASRIFERTSFDLIYARPGQTITAWRKELTRALGEQQGHMSLYQLTIEPDTAFERLHSAGKLIVPDDDHAAALYDVTQELTDKAGLPAYEISNHAAPGQQSRHNLLYWRYGEYAGVGAGAHSRLLTRNGRVGLSNEANPERWLQMVETSGSGITETEQLSRQDQAREFLLMGLRLEEGINLERCQQLFGVEIAPEKIADLSQQGFIISNPAGNTIAASKTGMRVLNSLIAFLA
ncbi:MAG TPA: coproporphyrinogen III oxidase [Rhizobiales bacterium]|nr:coproporphyrinogen III oxidase [Hyphomicrobiales bacterium]